MKTLLSLLLTFALFVTANAVSTDSTRYVYKFTLLDFPYIGYAARTLNSAISNPTCKPNTGDYFKSFANPSMQQSTDISASMYTAVHSSLGHIKTTNSALTKGIGNMSILWFDAIAVFLPFGTSWQHEEFHRAVLTKNYTNSFNDVYKFKLFSTTINVSNELDTNLAMLKKRSNPDFVRMSACGIEGEYALIRTLQKDNFFQQQHINHYILYWLSSLNSISYIALCANKTLANYMTDDANKTEGTSVSKRDFTGFDFTAWAYDLYNPIEPYNARGIHPSGVGYDRYIRGSDLTKNQRNYIAKQAILSLLNLVSPIMLNRNEFRLSKDQDVMGTFAFRHVLTSFGNDLSLDAFIRTAQYNWIFTSHLYQNNTTSFPGFEAELYDFPIIKKNNLLYTTVKSIVWLQPKNQNFITSKEDIGGLLSVRASLKLARHIYPYFQLDGKTAGWVMGNEFLESKITSKFGIILRFGK